MSRQERPASWFYMVVSYLLNIILAGYVLVVYTVVGGSL